MSLSPVSVHKKFRDDQFIADLMNLFERRKIKIGDPGNFEDFSSILASNDAFRSQLFTLCTAISHMAESDLSGEQLLALVARALGGPTLPKRDGAIEVPDSMRSAFLSGFDAWTNRASEPKEPLPWPAPKQPEPRDEPLPPQTASAQPAGPKPASPGMRTVQEALDIARERSLADPAAHPSARRDPNTEGLTLAELKALLEEMENRVARLQPHLHDFTSAAHSPADALERRATMHEIDAAHSHNLSPQAFPPVDASTPPIADTSTGSTLHGTSRPARINEAAFLARHAYLRPPRPVVSGSQAAGLISASAPPQLIASPAAASAPAAPIAAIATVPGHLDALIAVTAPAAPILAPPIAVAPPVVAAAPPPPAPSLTIIAARPDSQPYFPHLEASSLAVGRIRVTPRMAAGILIGFAAFIVVVSGVAGLFVYPSLHPKTANDYPDLRQAASPPGIPRNSAPPADAASTAQMILTAPGDPLMTAPRASRYRTPAASKPHATAQPGVWPFTNQVAVREVTAPPAPAAPGSSGTHRIASPAATPPLYVPSSTLIAYALSAPQPSYPKNQVRGVAGTVVVQIAVSRDGTVSDIRVVSGPLELRPAIVQTVQGWRFRPYLVNGTPADVTTTLGFLFKGQ